MNTDIFDNKCFYVIMRLNKRCNMVEFKVTWNRYDEKFKCIIGYLTYDEVWQFCYDEEGYSIATKIGFVGFPEFPDSDEIYQSEKLFKTFTNRIRNSENKTEEGKIESLEKTGGLLATDNIEITRTLSKERQKTYGTN